MTHEIFCADRGDSEQIYTYFEGLSGKLAMWDVEQDGRNINGGWFCFEELYPKGCVELMKLGFTAKQIEAATIYGGGE